MTQLISYTYSALRYVHDSTTGEFVNVGVALYAPDVRFVGALCRNTYGRLSKVFPGVHGEHFRSLMQHIERRFEQFAAELRAELPFEQPKTIAELARRVLPADDSALQWAPIGSGRTANAETALEQLYDRMVMRYDDKPVREHRTEDDVWRRFKRTLESRQLLQHFQPVRIAVQDDEIEFEHAWKNGVLHCVEPVSFDLSSPESIKDKAHRWLGRITSVAGADEKFHLYLLVGQPREEQLRPAFESALSILGKIPVPTEIVREEDSEHLSEQIARDVREHLGSEVPR